MVVTSSLNRTGRAVACVQLVPVLVEVVVLVVAVAVVVDTAEPHRPLLRDEDGINARGSPETIGTGMFPLESTVMDVQVYSSVSLVPDEYPLPLSDNVYDDPEAPLLESTVMTDPFFMANVWLS